jgi:hypothetical protein
MPWRLATGCLVLLFVTANAMPAACQSTKPAPPSAGVSASPEQTGKKKSRLDYKHARPFPLPSIDCEPSNHGGSSTSRPDECKPATPQKDGTKARP